MKKITLLALAVLGLAVLAQGCGQRQKKASVPEAAQVSAPAAAEEEDPDVKWGADLLKPGVEAPDFTLGDLDGKEVKLSDFRGKSVVLVFWASWCPDCRAEIPALKQMFSDADPSKVAFLSVSFDRKFEDLVQFAKDNALPGVQLFDPAGKKESKVAEAFGVKWIPSLCLVGPDGKIVLSTVVADRVAAALKQ